MSDATAAWDQDLAPAEVWKLSPADKGERVRVSFERKVQFLEGLTRGPIALTNLDVQLTKTRTALRKWKDVERKLWPWADAKTDEPGGKNDQLVKRFHAAMEALYELQKGKHYNLKQELRAKDLVIEELERQVFELTRLLDKLSKSMKPKIEAV